jgi:hypothetical protein
MNDGVWDFIYTFHPLYRRDAAFGNGVVGISLPKYRRDAALDMVVPLVNPHLREL